MLVVLLEALTACKNRGMFTWVRVLSYLQPTCRFHSSVRGQGFVLLFQGLTICCVCKYLLTQELHTLAVIAVCRTNTFFVGMTVVVMMMMMTMMTVVVVMNQGGKHRSDRPQAWGQGPATRPPERVCGSPGEETPRRRLRGRGKGEGHPSRPGEKPHHDVIMPSCGTCTKCPVVM